jgi:hypothetical protein
MPDMKTSGTIGGIGALSGAAATIAAIAILNGGGVLEDQQVTTLGQAQVDHIAAVSAAVQSVPDGVTAKDIDSVHALIYGTQDVGNGEKQLPPIRFDGKYEIPSGALVEQVLRVNHVEVEANIVPWTCADGKIGKALQYMTIYEDVPAVKDTAHAGTGAAQGVKAE